MSLNKFYTILLLALMPFKAWAGGSVIGHGGDPIFHFLETTRFALVEILKIHASNKKDRPNFCSNISSLSKQQIQFCQQFLEQVRDQMLFLNQGNNKTKFILRKKPLLVPGPDGKPMQVAARTPLGPGGDIEFHRNSVQFYSPSRALFLIIHELGHKVSFQGKYLNDFEAVGPFSTGRELLDVTAESLTKIAKELGKIGAFFGLRDFFRCEIIFPNAYKSGMTTSSPRFFFSKDLLQYQSGLSRTPQDPEIFVYESDHSKLVYQIKINENNGCLDPKNSKDLSSSESELKIIRIFEPDENGQQNPDELVNSLSLSFNPICQKKPEWLSISANDLEFGCLYLGTQGSTHSDISLYKLSNKLMTEKR